jgi:uncharacterized membrane protein YedE/YeeE
MFSTENYEIYELVNIVGLLIGLAFGIIAQKKQFCFSGSIKDYILTNSTKRASSVIMAMIVAIISTYLISSYYEIDLTQTNFYKDDINYFTIIFGGALFGIGMMIADGCSSRHLIKFAQGDSNSLVTVLFIGIFAYATTKGILYYPLSQVTSNATLIEISSYIENIQVNIFFLLIPLLIALWFLTKSFKRILSLKDGFLIGLLISFGWYTTGVIGADAFERQINLSSMTFVYPTAKSLELFSYYEVNQLTFGISIIIGVLLGAFAMSKVNRKYSFGCTSNLKTSKLKNSMIGGALMGIGGVMAIGCTVGQGLTGLSTLAFASIVAIISILSSGYITAIYLNKKNQLPMCFIFEWEDEKKS